MAHHLLLAQAHVADHADHHALLAAALVGRQPVSLDVPAHGRDLLLRRGDGHHDEHRYLPAGRVGVVDPGSVALTVRPTDRAADGRARDRAARAGRG